ncbi:MAG: SPASM domain-containing protein [Desulfobacteraceae bacterium]|nr:SPASM domain-containing protein [Desulfobacteraceae bacterium]
MNMKYIDSGGKCKYGCSFCYFTNSKHPAQSNNNKLSSHEIKDLTAQANELGVQVHFSSDKFISSPPSDPVTIECLKHKNSCFIGLDGIVYPCAGLPLAIGDIRRDSLRKIFADSEVIENLRNHEYRIKGPCRRCENFSDCYGCRARTFALTGDYLGSDPLCPKNQDKLDEITYLPMPVDNLIPQKQGMRVVSALLKVGERTATTESVFSNKSPFIKESGCLEEVAFMEIMAQSAAVMNGFEKYDTGAPAPDGFLIGGREINIYSKAFVKEKLITDIYKTARFGNFGVLTATIKHNDDLIAEGEIKIYDNQLGG